MSIIDNLLLRLKRVVKPHEVLAGTVAKYVGLLFVLFVLLGLIRYHLNEVGDPLDGFLISLLDNLSAGIITAAVAAVLLFFVSPRISLEENLAVLDAWNINPALKKPLATTRLYYFRGRSGRWVRAQVLPALATAASRESIQRDVHLILPDPANTDVLRNYAEYRNSLPHDSTDSWSSERIRNEIIATILEAGRLASRNIFFQAQVALLTDFSLFRADLSDDALILTREDPRMPGWFTSSSTRFYASYKEDLRIAERRGQQVELYAYEYHADFAASDVNSALQAMRIEVTLSEQECSEVRRIMSSPSYS